MIEIPHKPVLLDPLMELLRGRRLVSVVDGTVGAAGHSSALLQEHPEIAQLIGIDKDPLALSLAKERLTPWAEKILLLQGDFAFWLPRLKEQQKGAADLILLDLGVSSMQLDLPEKGFSFMREGPLDMRMDPTQELTAAHIVNCWDEQSIGRILREYGEELQWRRAARKIVEERQLQYIATTLQLAVLLDQVLRPGSKKTLHPLTKTFQALRIAVNGELEALAAALASTLSSMAPGALLAVIAFHSLEDRLVKQAFQLAASDKCDTRGIGVGLFHDKAPEVRLVTRKPIVATDQEIAENPRSRSARLRVVEKL